MRDPVVQGADQPLRFCKRAMIAKLAVHLPWTVEGQARWVIWVMRWTSGVDAVRLVQELPGQVRSVATCNRGCAADSHASRTVSLARPLAQASGGPDRRPLRPEPGSVDSVAVWVLPSMQVTALVCVSWRCLSNR